MLVGGRDNAEQRALLAGERVPDADHEAPAPGSARALRCADRCALQADRERALAGQPPARPAALTALLSALRSSLLFTSFSFHILTFRCSFLYYNNFL